MDDAASWIAVSAVAMAVASRCSSSPRNTLATCRRLGPSTYSETM